MLALDKKVNSVTHIEGGGSTDERVWVILHTVGGPMLLCNWYRPPGDAESEDVQRYGEEHARLREGTLGSVTVGDVNVHNIEWLIHSRTTAPEGKQLEK